MNQEVKNVFAPGAIVTYRSARKISSHLVRAKLYPLERKFGSEKCGRSRHSGFLGIVSITLIDKTDGKDPKRRENYCMRALKTYAPFELNNEDSV